MPRGRPMKTPERVAEAKRLREEEALTWKEISERLGVTAKTAHAWVRDPDGTKLRAAKDRYRRPCVDCDAPTSGSDGHRAEPRCLRCSSIHVGARRKIWTQSAVICAIQEWAHEYGEPPAIVDWNPWQARQILGDKERAQRFEKADGQWPAVTTVVTVFVTWNAAIEAAGFTPRPAGGTRENWERSRRGRST